jgi:hypothetical protein
MKNKCYFLPSELSMSMDHKCNYWVSANKDQPVAFTEVPQQSLSSRNGDCILSSRYDRSWSQEEQSQAKQLVHLLVLFRAHIQAIKTNSIQDECVHVIYVGLFISKMY